jgi:hypothetical protein
LFFSPSRHLVATPTIPNNPSSTCVLGDCQVSPTPTMPFSAPHASAMLVRDSRTSSANGAFGLHEARQRRDEATHGSIAVPIKRPQINPARRATGWAADPKEPVRRWQLRGENSMGIRLACRSFHAAISFTIGDVAAEQTLLGWPRDHRTLPVRLRAILQNPAPECPRERPRQSPARVPRASAWR